MLLPSDLRLTASAMVYSRELGEFREIDIIATTTGMRFDAKVAIEAKNEGRKLTRPHIETICGRFFVKGSTKVDQVIVVSRNGFTKGAKKMAALNGIRLLILDKSTANDWKKCFPACLQELPKTMTICGTLPEISNCHVFPRPNQPTLDGKMSGSRIACQCSGRDYGPIEQFVWEQILSTDTWREWWKSPGDRPFLHLDQPMSGLLLVTKNGETVELEQISFDVRSCNGTTDLEFTTYDTWDEDGKKQTAHIGIGSLGGKTVKQIIGPEGHKIMIDFTGEPAPIL